MNDNDIEMELGIQERETLMDIWKMADRYYDAYGVDVENVSHWNPSKNFQKSLSGLLKLPTMHPIVDYVMSLNMPESDNVLSKLGFSRKCEYALITPTGTVSILSAISLLKEQGVERIVLFAPFYWTVFYVCNQLSIEVEMFYLYRDCGKYKYPEFSEIFGGNLSDKTAFWFTNPIYCTGVHLDEITVEVAKLLIEKKAWVIFDECLCSYERNLGPHLSGHEKFLGIYAPHKSICVNGLKFSTLVTHQTYRDFVDHWSTIHYGCLSVANKVAAQHFISKNFDTYLTKFTKKINRTREYILSLSEKYDGFSIDPNADSYLNTLYFERYSGDASNDLVWLWELVKNTGTIIIPGIRNHFSVNIGFCFRVNLAADSPRFRHRLEILISYLSKAK